ncbi:MAG: hypothetical protein ACREK5_05450 [Gemmatimonadota bacterium]
MTESKEEAVTQTAESQGTNGKESKRTVHRSPLYPMFDLESAIDLARQLYEHESFNWVSRDVVVSHWGYTSKSSRGLRTIAALVSYGLVEETGTGKDRRIRLSELGKDILLDEREESADRQRAIRKAALSPEIYAELWKEWGPDLPSDSEMEYRLIREKGFNPNAVRSFITDFRNTVRLANLMDSAIMDEEGEDAEDDSELPPVNPSREKEKAMPSVNLQGTRPWDLTIPLVSGGQAILRAPIPMTEEDFDHLKSFLDATLQSMRKAITRPNNEPEPED